MYPPMWNFIMPKWITGKRFIYFSKYSNRSLIPLALRDERVSTFLNFIGYISVKTANCFYYVTLSSSKLLGILKYRIIACLAKEVVTRRKLQREMAWILVRPLSTHLFGSFLYLYWITESTSCGRAPPSWNSVLCW